MTNTPKIKGRPKVRILESVLNKIINTVGSRPAESGGLLFGNEEDMIITDFVFDENARTTRTTYSFNVGFLNPEIKRLWTEKRLSCIGFLHSHPPGYSWPSPPDMTYFTSMFEAMPRKHYIIPILHCVPDGGYKMNTYILPNGSGEAIKADIEILPDDYFENNIATTTSENNYLSKNLNAFTIMKQQNQSRLYTIIGITWTIWKLILALGLTWFLFNVLYLFLNHLHKIWP